MQYTINSADTWERKTFSIAGDTSGVINDDNGDGFIIAWGLASGTNKTSGSLRSSWTAQATADQFAGQGVNLLDSTSNEWYMTGAQLEVGSQATAFEHRSMGEELALCQRYYQVCVEGNNQFVCFGDFFTSTQCDGGVQLGIEMRETPTIDANTGSDYYIVYTNSTQSNIDGSLTIFKAHKRAVLWYSAADTGRTAGHANRWITQHASAKIAFDAEL